MHALRHSAGKITLLIISSVPNQPDLLFLLHDIARLLRVSGDRRARAHGMTRAQWVILWQLQRQPGLSQKELAEIMEVEPISVARLVDRLAARAMVERRDDPTDRRIWRLHLLPPAYSVLDHMRTERDDVAELLATGLSPQTLAMVRQSLIAMKANVLSEMRARPTDQPLADPSSAPLPSPSRSTSPPILSTAPTQARPVSRRRAIATEPELQQDRP